MDAEVNTESPSTEESPGDIVERYMTEVKLYERKREIYDTRAKKIIKRYKDERPIEDQQARKKLNLLWANMETLRPAVYAQAPKAEIKRRFNDRDHVGRVASTILERAVSYFLDCEEGFDDMMRLVRDSYLLVGLGVNWQRYVPHMKSEDEQVQVTNNTDGSFVDSAGNVYDEAEQDEQGVYRATKQEEVVDYEEVIDDYVHWQDFGHNVGARVWDEVYLVWRCVFMTRKELVERFGEEIGRKVPLDELPEGSDKDSKEAGLFKKAKVYEFWDKGAKKACWIARGYKDEPLDQRDDPLRLKMFFPCPKPMFGTLGGDNLIPSPDYALYQDQAEEIDELTGRISHLTKALRVKGLYAGDIDEVQRLFRDGDEADLIPVQNWQALLDKGGLKDVISWVPLKDIADALIQLYAAREQAKQDLYEITGLSDIMRGSTKASETLGAQQIKAQWGSMRVREKQQELARYARDNIRIKAEIIAEHFAPETIALIANVESLPQADQEFVQEALRLLTNDPIRNFRVEIESDSTIAADEQADKESRVEFLTAVTSFIQGWAPVITQVPALAPMAAEMLKFAVRGFKAGDNLEMVIEQVMESYSGGGQPGQGQGQQEGQEAQPSPEDVARMMQEIQELRAKLAEIEGDKTIDQEKIDIEKYKAETDRMQAAAQSGAVFEPIAPAVPPEALEQFAALAQQMALPKQVVRDESGEVVGMAPIDNGQPPQRPANMAEAVALISQALAAASGPKKIVRDQAGEVVGVVPAGMGTA